MSRSDRKIFSLAKIVSKADQTDERVKRFLVAKLTRGELKLFLKYLEKEINKDRIIISVADGLTNDIKNKLKEIFKDKTLIFHEDKILGAGIKVKVQDDLIDMSVKGLIDSFTSRI